MVPQTSGPTAVRAVGGQPTRGSADTKSTRMIGAEEAWHSRMHSLVVTEQKCVGRSGGIELCPARAAFGNLRQGRGWAREIRASALTHDMLPHLEANKGSSRCNAGSIV